MPPRTSDVLVPKPEVPSSNLGGAITTYRDGPSVASPELALCWPNSLTVGSLFSGIGGFDLGFQRAGFQILFQVEIDEYCQRVLQKHWPDVPRYGDIRTITDLPYVDVLCGGFPCQDISNAGKRAGIDGNRSGLWSEMARIIRMVRPQYVVVENVSALLHRGMERVLGDLAACGFDAEWDCIPASAIGAPHRRDRVWLVAYDHDARIRRNQESRTPQSTDARPTDVADASRHVERRLRRTWQRIVDGSSGQGRIEHERTESQESKTLANAAAERCRLVGTSHDNNWQESSGNDIGRCRADVANTISGRRDGQPWNQRQETTGRIRTGEGGKDVADPQEFAVGSGLRSHESAEQWWRRSGDCGGARIFSDSAQGDGPAMPSGIASFACDWWATEPDVGRVAHGIPFRVERLKGLGNALVPQIAEWIARRILNYERSLMEVCR